MTTLEVGRRLVELCREGKNHEAMTELYADDIVSVEAGAPPGGDATTKGMAGVLAKSQWWADNHEVHAAKVDGPWPHGDRFIVHFNYDITLKASGNRVTMDEVGLYTVKDGKVAKEEFFYAMG